MDDDQAQSSDAAIAAQVELGVRLVGLDDLPAQYVNLISINFDQYAFQLVFAQAMQPVVTAPSDVEEMQSRGYVPATVMARLVLTPVMMEQTIDLLMGQLDRYRQQAAGRTPGNTQENIDD